MPLIYKYSILILFCLIPALIKAGNLEENLPQFSVRTIEDISISGNIKTKNKVILTELPFKIGSKITDSELLHLIARAKENIQNTSLFNLVEIDFYFPTRHTVSFNIKVEERWYLWAFPLFEQDGRNFSDFLRLNDASFLNYGIYLKHDNFRGRKEVLKLRLITGYKTQVLFDYQKPGFNQQSGWGITAGWLMFDHVAYQTNNDTQVFLKTLGTSLLRQSMLKTNYFYRHQLDHHHKITISYFDTEVADTLLALNPHFLALNNTHSKTVEIGYQYQYDRRNSKIYPLTGNSYEFQFHRKGFELEEDYNGFFQVSMTSSFHKQLFHKFYGSTKVLFSAVDQTEVPYVYKTGLGYQEYLNGFEFKVINGTKHGAIQNKLLFEVIPRTDKTIKWIPLSQFARFHYALYLRAHFDAGYVINDHPFPTNRMANTALFGYGLGIDLVTVYDRVLSINYSMNNFKERGIFVHFNLGI